MDDSSNSYKKVVESQDRRSQEFAKQEDVKVSLREQIPKKLLKKLRDLNQGQAAIDLWNRADANRSERHEKIRRLRIEVEEFFQPLYKAPLPWSSTLHYPVALTVCKTYHARIFAATWDMDEKCMAKARKSANQDSVPVVNDLMHYTLTDWANYGRGIEREIDSGLDTWIKFGDNFWKTRWDRRFEKLIDVVDEEVEAPTKVQNPETGEIEIVYTKSSVEVEKEVIKKIFDGPCAETVPPGDVLTIGNDDPDLAEHVMQMIDLTASDLNMYADQGIFEKAAVDEVLSHAADRRPNAYANRAIKEDIAHAKGESDASPSYESEKYTILECYSRIPIDSTGIASEVVYWVHKQSGQILRATYLRRISPSGKRPFAWAEFMPNKVGLIEMIYNLTKEIDAIRNMRLDFGLISSMPFGYYRPSSSMSTAEIPLAPGKLVPLDNPMSDVVFPQLGNRTVFGFQEEASIYSMIERVTNMSDLSLGLLSGQGAARTATGARAVMGESNININIFLRRINRALKKLYCLIFEQVQQKLPEGFEFRVVDNFTGKDMFLVINPSQIEGFYDFELDPNSSNSNKQVQLDVANEVYQLTSNPLDIQLGLVTPSERYEAIKNKLQVMGIRDFSRFVRKPDQHSIKFSPQEMFNRAASGFLELNPAMDLQGFLAYVEEFKNDDLLLGQLQPHELMGVMAKAQEAQQMLQALQEMQAQQANASQMQQNASMSPVPTDPGAPVLSNAS
jgi:hypothetical protein